MFRISIFAIVLCSMFSLNIADCTPCRLNGFNDLINVQNSSRISQDNPKLTIIIIQQSNVRDRSILIRGKRIEGDRLVDLQDNGDGWTDRRDVKLEVNYPIQGGAGACITFVELTLFHNSDRNVSAQFTCGDVYFRNFGIQILIPGTTYYSYRAMIYGVI